MNITHAKTEEIKGDRLEAIFNRQKELMEKYHHIEAKSGLCQTEDCPVNLDDKRGQARLKDFAWRATEEVAEAFETLEPLEEAMRTYNMEVYPLNPEVQEEKVSKLKDTMKQLTLHLREELIDALHFLTEFTILAGINPNDIVDLDLIPVNQFTAKNLEPDRLIVLEIWIREQDMIMNNIKIAGMDFITQLGIACNFLKNKPWKQTNMITDKERFKMQVIKTWEYMIVLLISAGLDSNDIADLYLKKSQVNKFRQRSNY